MPGVSSIAAVPAAAGIPVAHRGLSDRVTVVSRSSGAGDELARAMEHADKARAPRVR